MRPDLFAGPALRDDRHRILARLANGGSVPAPVRRWIRWDAPQRAHLAAVATLLAMFRVRMAEMETMLISGEHEKLIEMLLPVREARLNWAENYEQNRNNNGQTPHHTGQAPARDNARSGG